MNHFASNTTVKIHIRGSTPPTSAFVLLTTALLLSISTILTPTNTQARTVMMGVMNKKCPPNYALVPPDPDYESYTHLSSGGYHSCGITLSGHVRCWGYNGFGQLGNGTTTDSSIPQAIVDSSTYVSISAGEYHTCGVTASGTIKCWGNNTYGQLGDGTTNSHSTPVTVKDPSGTADLNNIKQIEIGSYHSCAIDNAEAVLCWGKNTSGELGNGQPSNRTLPDQTKGPAGAGFLTNIKSISLGYEHTCALNSSGIVFCWGKNYNGQLGINSTTQQSYPTSLKTQFGSEFSPPISAISAGYYHSCGQTLTGDAYCWGDNTYGQLGDNTTTDRTYPIQVKGLGGSGNLTNISSISAGGKTSCAASTTGFPYCWGHGNDYAIGNGLSSTTYVPATVTDYNSSTLAQIASVTGGFQFNCALSNEGSVYCWGKNHTFQIGVGPQNISNIKHPNIVYDSRSRAMEHKYFCVSQYEMKNDGSGHFSLGRAIATPSGTPWTNISLNDAKLACQYANTSSTNGGFSSKTGGTSRFKLISNNQWQVIARNISRNPANWGSSSSKKTLSHGIVLNSSSPREVSSPNDICSNNISACGKTPTLGNWDYKSRVSFLSNGEYIWDLVGNAWEWVDGNGNLESDIHGAYTPSRSALDAYISLNVNFITNTNFGSGPNIINNSALCDNDYNTSPFCGLGKVYNLTPASTSSNTALIRGGGYGSNPSDYGPFSAITKDNAYSSMSDTGFRCVYEIEN